jgi:hypothetical protein
MEDKELGGNTVIDEGKALVPVGESGTVSDLEVAYQQARRQLDATIEQLRKAFDAVNTVQPQLLEAWFREAYPGLGITVKHQPPTIPGHYSVDYDVSANPGVDRETLKAIGTEGERYLEALAGPFIGMGAWRTPWG